MIERLENGTYRMAPRPTRLELVRHAERFGIECVAETAACWMGVEELAGLIETLDRLEAVEDSKRRFAKVKRHTKTPDQRARKMLGIEEDE